MDFENDVSLSSFNIHLRPLIVHLLKNSVGLVVEDLSDDVRLRLCDYSTGKPCIDYSTSLSSENKDVDRFSLKIPYASKNLIWEVVLNSLSPEDPPDFNLNDDNFTSAIDAEILEKFVPSLISWKYDDPASLKNIVAEFVSFFKKYQLGLLKEDNYCWFEYLSVLKSDVISENDIEVWVANTGLTHFLIRLTPDLTDYELPLPPSKYGVFVAVCFNSNCGSKMLKPQMKFAQPLKDCLVMPLAGASDSTDNDNLAKYLIRLKERVEDSMMPRFLKPIAKRKRLIFEWLSIFGRKVIEFDAIKFHSVSFLIENEGFSCILLIHLRNDFTTSPPEYHFQSVYSEKPLVVPISTVPYNPNWTIKNMMTKAVGFIESKVNDFRTICMENM